MNDFVEHDQDTIYDNIMDKYIPVVKKNVDQIMKEFPEFSNYTELENDRSLSDLEDALEKRIRKDTYQRIKATLAKMYDSLAYEIEKRGRK